MENGCGSSRVLPILQIFFPHFVEEYLQFLRRFVLALLLLQEVHPLLLRILEPILEVLVHHEVIGRGILGSHPRKEIFVLPQEEASGNGRQVSVGRVVGVNPIFVLEEVVGLGQCLDRIDQLGVARIPRLGLVKDPSVANIGAVAKDAVIGVVILVVKSERLFLQGLEHAGQQKGIGERILLLVPDFATFIVDAELVHEDDEPSERSLEDVGLVEQRIKPVHQVVGIRFLA